MDAKDQLDMLKRLYEFYMRQNDYISSLAVQYTLETYAQKDFFDVLVLKAFLNEINR
ncbi:hypothetical protein ACQKTA_12055 (plasmid) [Enterococcus sp. 22-H-5-01]|uniref:hypothetical protein n=1 Tax=Enterococcus sp. 22-H-5-01 TaxID=3418555 RepID=UPI003D00A333